LVDRKTGGNAAVVDIETIDTADPDYAAVVELFDRHSIWALPIITIDGKAVCWDTIDPDQIENVLEQELGISA
jgi:predicted thioredoxin/glutaredoxin